jgi:hypothetical protein
MYGFDLPDYIVHIPEDITIIVFSPDSPATRSMRSIGNGGESSSMLTSVEGNAVQAFCTRKNASN